MKQSNETRSEMEARHENETKELELATSKLLKNSKKSTRAQVEAQIIQMQFDLRAKHREEEDNFESEYNESIDEIIESKKNIAKPVSAAEEIEKKRAKAKAKQEKKLLKEKERLSTIEQSKALLTGPSLREKEIDQIDNKLKPISMKIKDIASDGNCLYRAIADQLQLEYPDRKLDWVQLRMSAARHIRSNREEYAPFIGLSAVMTAEEEIEFEEYCNKVESPTLAEWGGEVEIKALSRLLDLNILVYSADSPTLLMGEENGSIPLRISYHRHYYSLGAHYNSVIPI